MVRSEVVISGLSPCSTRIVYSPQRQKKVLPDMCAQISLRIRADISESALGGFWIAKDVNNEDSDQSAHLTTKAQISLRRCAV